MDSVEAQSVFPLEGGLSTTLAVGLGIAIIVEGVAIHLWVGQQSMFWAWIIAVVNLATLVWLWREVRARSLSRLVVGVDHVEVVVGRRLRCEFPLSAIANAQVATWRSVPDLAPDFVNTAKPLEPNVILTMRQPVEVRLPLGIKKRVGRFGLRVQDPSRVVALLGGISC